MSSTIAWCLRSCAAIEPVRQARCARTSSPLAKNTRYTRSRCSLRLLSHKRAPAAEVRNVLCAGGRVGFDQKAFDAAAVGECERADRERRRNIFDKSSERRVPQRPQLDFNGAPAAARNAE